MPTNAKFRSDKGYPRPKELQVKANRKPNIAPVNKEGAKTPPIPPALIVTDVAMGFKKSSNIKMPRNIK